MLKKMQKILAISIMLIMLMAVTCYAEDTAEVLSSEAPAEVVATSEAAAEDVATADDTTTADSSSTEMLSNDLYLIDQTISYEGIVDGNAYILGNEVTLDAVIGGDVFVLANTLTIGENSLIYGNLYVLANNVTLDGYVYGGDLYAACAELTVSESAAVNRDIRICAGKLTLNGGVGRNIYAGLNELVVGENAQVYGDLNYDAPRAAEIPTGVVMGNISYTESIETEDVAPKNPVMEYLISLASTIVLVLAIFGLMLLLTPKFLKKAENAELKGILPSLGIGAIGVLGAIIVGIPVGILLLISKIGASAALVILAIWFLLAFSLSMPVAIVSIAGILANKVEFFKKAHNILAIILATIVVWAIGLIPFVGGIVTLLITMYGCGQIIRIQWSSRKEE